MASKVAWLITDHNITVNYEGQTHIVPRTDPLADRLIKAVKEKKLEQIPGLVSAAQRIEKFSKGNFQVVDGEILINGIPAPKVLGDKIVRFSDEGLPFQPLVKFAENLQSNPSFRAVNELYQFLEKNNHPITENGNFIAYKRVRSDFKDIYTGTMDNSVGKTVSMPRNMVNEDPTQTCSYGLHAANWDYAHNIYSHAANDIMLELEINPADVVAVPVDYDQAKMRVCKYKVLGVMDQAHSTNTSLRVVDTEGFKYEEDEEDEEIEHDTEYCISCGDELTDYDVSCGADTCEICEDEEDDYPWEDEV
jgi:hypothetical protein